jgi:hypothetical protein
MRAPSSNRIGPSTALRSGLSARGFAALDRAPSYVELLTCLEMAKQAKELPVESTMGAVTNRP